MPDLNWGFPDSSVNEKATELASHFGKGNSVTRPGELGAGDQKAIDRQVAKCWTTRTVERTHGWSGRKFLFDDSLRSERHIAVGTLFGTAKYRGQSAGLWSVIGVMTDHPRGISERERSLPSSCWSAGEAGDLGLRPRLRC